MIAGSARGRRLRSLDSMGVRPTTDRLKESLFSTLGPEIRGKRVLDLFAGSGALGIEALSRGARHATFVDSSPPAIAMIKANLAATGLGESAHVVRQKAEAFAAGDHPGGTEPFDLVLADPPYETGIPARALERLLTCGRLAPGAMVVVEVSSRLKELTPPLGYRLLDSRKYGDSKLLYLTEDEGGE